MVYNGLNMVRAALYSIISFCFRIFIFTCKIVEVRTAAFRNGHLDPPDIA